MESSKQTRKASGEAPPPALPAKRTEEEDTAPSTSTSSDDGMKGQRFNHRAIFKMTLIEEIAQSYKGASNFQLGDKTLTFTVEDVALILGLPSCGSSVPHYSSPIKLSKLHHRFVAKLTFDRKVVTKLIRQLVQSDDPCDVEDTTRLWIVLLLSTFLCPRSSPSCPPQMLICLNNIDEVGRYNWAAAVTEMTLHKFDDFVTIVREKRSGRNTTPKRRIAGREHGSANIFGCSAALDIIKHLKLASKEKIAITCVSQEKMHVETEGVAAPPHPALMALLQGLGNEIRLLPERLEQYKSCNEGHFEALTTAVTTGFNKMKKLISSTSMAQDQPTVGTDAENFVSTQPSLTPAPAAPAYGNASASVLIVDQGIIAPDPVSVVPTTALLSPTSLIKNMKCRDDPQPGIYDQSPFRRLDKASKKRTSYQRKKGKKAMSTLFRFYKQWTCKSEATERQRALVEAFIAEEGYVDHKHTVLNFINNCSLKWSHIWDILWGNMTDDEVIDIVLHAMKVRQREQEALIPNSYHRWEFLGTILGSWIMHTDGSDDDRGHKLHTSLGDENLGCPISDFQFLFFVVHVSNHWFLLSLQLEQRRIVVYNSCRGHPTYDTCARKWEPILKAYLRYEGYRNADEFQLILDEICPQQPSSSMNCAMYIFITELDGILRPRRCHLDNRRKGSLGNLQRRRRYTRKEVKILPSSRKDEVLQRASGGPSPESRKARRTEDDRVVEERFDISAA
ncbi:hypothetical protein Taro_016514 [Colocasia esculenta]|uniref:Ubiquitin-like protease family profile domain-containing protein n=1 Tax=Colocasia esculenta TaxID=4460 RepID=A0A843UWG9_COLES|nr:hypothetical protein [Colocasia esculenta]